MSGRSAIPISTGCPALSNSTCSRGREAEDHTLYSSYTLWKCRADFDNWTQSDEFRKAHEKAGAQSSASLFLGHPKFEGFEVKQTLTVGKAA